jgi:choline dehydrogenase-like flavoprotein
VLIDAISVGAGKTFDCDLCIIGGGAAGITIARRLRNTGLSVMLLESGRINLNLATQKLYRGEVVGDHYFRLDACRWRVLGGSTTRWGGWCRPLESVDFLQRDWIDHSGWPIDARTLASYEAEAADLFELPNARFDLETWGARMGAPLPLAGSHFVNTVFQHSPETNFSEKYRADLMQSPNLTTMLNANVVQMRLDRESRRLASLTVATTKGVRFFVRPKAVCLAAGGIENARLLLASRADRPAGLGNEHDLVGRYFMEHLHAPVGHLVVNNGTQGNAFFRKLIFNDVRLRGVIRPTPEAQERHRLLGTSIALENPSFELGTPFVGWPPALTFGPVRAYRALRGLGLNRAAERYKVTAQSLQSIPGRIRSRNMARKARSSARQAGNAGPILSLYFRAEQAPDPDNRVVLSDRVDALGMQESRLQWKFGAKNIASIEKWLAILDQDTRTLGIGQVIFPGDDWRNGIIGGPHHMGATRMSADPRHGVVDADCRVHSVENLYIAGSSVFATGGYANPTFTLVALALRLADTLRRRLGPAAVTPAPAVGVSAP